MIRRTEQTVRRRVARIAPTTRVWALIQTRSENSGAKAARMATISGGRSTGVVSRADGLCSTIDRGHAPLDLPVNLAKVEWDTGDPTGCRAPNTTHGTPGRGPARANLGHH